MKLSESGPDVSDSLQPHGPYSPWNSPGQNTAVGKLFFVQGSSQPRSPALQVDSLPAEPQGKPKNTGIGSWSLLQWIFLTPGIKPGSPALQADSLPIELSGKPNIHVLISFIKMFIKSVCRWQVLKTYCCTLVFSASTLSSRLYRGSMLISNWYRNSQLHELRQSTSISYSKYESESVSHSVMSDSLLPHRL